MVDLDLYLAFVLATALLIAVPGPNVTLIVATSLSHGARRAMATVIGTQVAQAVQLLVVALGLAVLLHHLAEVFAVLKWAGVAYLLWLGIARWRNDGRLEEATPFGRGRLYWRGFLVALTNPKTWFFYAAFFPQFVDPSKPAAAQVAILSVTYLAIATIFDSGYALLAGGVRNLIATREQRRWLDRTIGTLLVGAAAWLATLRRSD